MKKIIIVASDPNSINSEIIFKTWKKINTQQKKKIYLIANINLIKKQFKKLKVHLPILEVDKLNHNNISNKLKVINIPLRFKNPFNVSLTNSRKYIAKSFNTAHNLCSDRNVGGMINCPTDKRLLHRTKIIGVTELLSKINKVAKDSEVMLIYNKKISVVPLTTHINLKKISKIIKKNLIIKKMKTLRKEYKKKFKINPKIAVLGLNPHNAELDIHSEEKNIIEPAILFLKKRGFKIEGPYSADTIFIDNYKKFDVIVGMYHDQVLAPFKSLFHFDAINITLGLKYLRLSPDHGPAKDIIFKNKANYFSLLNCIKFISKKS